MEGEAAAVARTRVVRCPKCDKFLPELPIYSVYVCGGCGATLQAKKNSTQSSHDPDNRNVRYLEVLECVPEASETMPGSSTADRSETNKMADVHSKSVYRRHANIWTGPSATNLNTAVRDNGREAKYRHIRDWESGEMGQSLRVRDISPRSPIDGIRTNAYCGEGLVDCHLKPGCRYSNREHSDERTLDGPSRVRGLEKDRAEILRMLDELRDQVQKSCDITDRPIGSAPTNRAADGPSSYDTCDQLSQLRHDVPQSHRKSSRQSPLLNVQSPSIPDYAALPAQQDRRGYAEPIAHARASSYPASLYPWRNFDNYFFGHDDPDPLLPCRHDGFCHQAACSCLHCCHQEFLPVQGNHLGFNDQRAPYLMNSYGAYPVESPLFGQQRYSTRGTGTTLQQNHTRANVSKKPTQTCEPVAGGAPFTICYNCYEVLQLPKKQSLSGKEYKLWCGSCSHAIVVKFDGSRLDVSEFPLGTHLSAGQQNIIDSGMGTNEQTADERSVPAYCFSDGSHTSQEKDLHSNLSESENNHNHLGTNSEYTSQSRDLPSEVNVVSHVPSLPHRDHCGFSPSEYSEVGSRSTHSEPEKIILLSESCKKNSIKDVCVANEKQSSDIEFDYPECTQGALNVQQDAGHTGVTKASHSFLTNLIKKSFKINNGMHNRRARVYVNGFPISDREVKKAEKQAGAICPGDYWYDYRAGFWGVMGRPCFGMIPPYIPEFNYPMPKNCAGGNTGIFVNGRELHQKDLDLLVARGLSDSPGRSYTVENSGKVSDEATGEELYGLGKLAPTVEKMGRGFGMRVPRVIQ
ncbi:uncharacterized protein LOC133926827 [Phragmites australis]|uniref:uncharacterized protein LOC133926827 n=1 Tax=Phragmites australis TaxID=29695 RepID=UPI002D786C81|nr:uncharacterized protein LOC133926827 [Phragmites australis]XP_062228936.1 uncharacterized protein LOC133926827 [Phragmites australis]XP_062228937.1 uncharacterized protein LOC133926827 [Phragmites australis]XP_062228938.1 uncharacterized protein LOC133926827 [Phragmites australis]